GPEVIGFGARRKHPGAGEREHADGAPHELSLHGVCPPPIRLWAVLTAHKLDLGPTFLGRREHLRPKSTLSLAVSCPRLSCEEGDRMGGKARRAWRLLAAVGGLALFLAPLLLRAAEKTPPPAAAP